MYRKKSLTASLILSGMVLCIILFASACEKDEPTASASFNPPGIYNGTYYVLRDWQTPDEDTSLANITIDFKGDLTFIMTINSVTQDSDFSPCSVNGTFIFRGDSLSFDYSNLNPHQEICDPTVGPQGVFKYYIVRNTLVFISRGTDYRKIELAGT